jgi:hypothetical protein
LVMAWASWKLLKPAHFGWSRLGLLSGGAALFFFVVSNFGVWLTQNLYAHDGAGLVACFVAAIPFFPATLVSAGVYSFALFALASIVDTWGVETAPIRTK